MYSLVFETKLNPFARPTAQNAGYPSVTQRWSLQPFGLKLQSIEADPHDTHDLLVALGAY